MRMEVTEQLLTPVPSTTIHILSNGETISCNEPASIYIYIYIERERERESSVVVVQSSETCKKLQAEDSARCTST